MMTKRTQIILFSMVIVVIAGISSRAFRIGVPVWDKYLGDALYAVLFYLLLSLLWRKGSPAVKTYVSCGVMLVIEIFQLTYIPLKLSMHSNMFLKLISIVLGTTFGWRDIVAYFTGILGVYLLDLYYSSQKIINYSFSEKL